jgi:hypothetical protein
VPGGAVLKIAGIEEVVFEAQDRRYRRGGLRGQGQGVRRRTRRARCPV